MFRRKRAGQAPPLQGNTQCAPKFTRTEMRGTTARLGKQPKCRTLPSYSSNRLNIDYAKKAGEEKAPARCRFRRRRKIEIGKGKARRFERGRTPDGAPTWSGRDKFRPALHRQGKNGSEDPPLQRGSEGAMYCAPTNEGRGCRDKAQPYTGAVGSTISPANQDFVGRLSRL